MIVREIITDPNTIIKHFDFFNDYGDTLKWLKMIKHTEIATLLTAAYTEWRKQKTKYWRNPNKLS